jgi:hypothetical protein
MNSGFSQWQFLIFSGVIDPIRLALLWQIRERAVLNLKAAESWLAASVPMHTPVTR